MNKKLVGSAVVGAAVLAIVAAQFLSSGPDAAPAAAPPPSPAPSIVSGALEVYRLADGPGQAIEIPVPADWAVNRDGERASYRRGELLLETDRVPITQEDALSGLKAVFGRQGGTVAGHAPIADFDAAEWNFTYDRDGAQRRVTVVGLGAGEALVTVRFDAPAADFERDRGVFDEALKIRS